MAALSSYLFFGCFVTLSVDRESQFCSASQTAGDGGQICRRENVGVRPAENSHGFRRAPLAGGKLMVQKVLGELFLQEYT